jgi:hypothetical protein
VLQERHRVVLWSVSPGDSGGFAGVERYGAVVGFAHQFVARAGLRKSLELRGEHPEPRDSLLVVLVPRSYIAQLFIPDSLRPNVRKA